MFMRLRAATPAMSVLALGVSTNVAQCSGEDHIPSLDYGWSHHGALQAFDKKAVRRGFQVYRQVNNIIFFRICIGFNRVFV
jgi:cytochrome c1